MSETSLYLQLHRATDADATKLLPQVAALVDADPLDELDDCIHEIASRTNVAAAALLLWLPETPNAGTSGALIRQLSVNHLQKREALTFDLAGADAASAILTCARLCTQALSPSVTLGWLLGLYSLVPESDAQRKRLGVLLTFHVTELPDTTLAILTAVPETERPPEVASAVTYLAEQDKVLKESPRLVELALGREERYALANLERRRQREIQRDAHAHSVFAQFAKPHHVKYSIRTSIEMDAGGRIYEQTMELQEHGVFVEMPLYERAMPLLGKVMRHRLWEGKF
jgi:hypothetical protein